jgi:Flp pilus assembly protein TadG
MHKQRAQTVVEFALFAPVMILLVLGILGVGRAFYTYVDLTNAARAGARYAIAQTTCVPSDIVAQVKAAEKDLTWPTGVTITPDCTSTDRRAVSITNYPFDTYTPFINQITLSATATLPI